MVEVVSLLVLTLLHQQQTCRESLPCRLSDMDILVFERGDDILREGFDMLVEVCGRVISHFFQNQQSKNPFLCIL